MIRLCHLQGLCSTTFLFPIQYFKSGIVRNNGTLTNARHFGLLLSNKQNHSLVLLNSTKSRTFSKCSTYLTHDKASVVDEHDNTRKDDLAEKLSNTEEQRSDDEVTRASSNFSSKDVTETEVNTAQFEPSLSATSQEDDVEEIFQTVAVADKQVKNQVQNTQKRDGSIIDRLRKLSMTDVSRYSNVEQDDEPILSKPKNIDPKLLQLVNSRNRLKSGGGGGGYGRYDDRSSNYYPSNQYQRYDRRPYDSEDADDGNERYSRNRYDDRQASSSYNRRTPQRYARLDEDEEEDDYAPPARFSRDTRDRRPNSYNARQRFAREEEDNDEDDAPPERFSRNMSDRRPNSYNNRQRFVKQVDDDFDDEDEPFDTSRPTKRSGADILTEQAQLRRGGGGAGGDRDDRRPRSLQEDDDEYEQIVRSRFAKLKGDNSPNT